MKIRSLTIRFNKEMRPFQHIRAEMEITLKDESNKISDETREEIKAVLRHLVIDLKSTIFPPEDLEKTKVRGSISQKPEQVAEPRCGDEEDNVPY